MQEHEIQGHWRRMMAESPHLWEVAGRYMTNHGQGRLSQKEEDELALQAMIYVGWLPDQILAGETIDAAAEEYEDAIASQDAMARP